MKDLIAKIDFFSGLEDKILRKLADASIMRQFTKNETIVRQGEMGLGLYVISRGHVRIDREQAGVKTQVAEIGPEQFFGEMSLLDNKPRSATCTSTEDTECLLLTRDSFVRLMNKYPEIPIRMARVLAERLRVANEKLATAPSAAAAAAAATPAPAQSASAPAAAKSDTAPKNGSAPPPNSSDESMKGKIHKQILDTFDSLYTVKAMTRLSVAVIGCPVEGHAANIIDRFEVGDVKVLVFSAGEPVQLRVSAHEPGAFTLHWFSPATDRAAAFGPIGIRPGSDISFELGTKQ